MNIQCQTTKEVSEKLFCLMKELGYSKSTIRIYQKLYSDFFSFVSKSNPDPIFSDQLTADYLIQYTKKNGTDTPSEKKRFRDVHRLMNMLMDCHIHGVILRHKLRNKTIPEPYAQEITAFCSYLIENGLSHGTSERNRFVLEQLSDFLIQLGKKNFSDMTMADMLSFSATQMGYSKKTIAATMYALRVFIDYLDKMEINHALCKDRLPIVRYVSRRHFSKIWTDEECRRLLGAVERNSPVGKRDYAILSLAINHGMRTSDILGLKFDDFDWGRGMIHFVQKKTENPHTVLLDETTGWAIIDYIRNGRPDVKLYANIFLQAKAPYLPMSSFNTCLQKYEERAGIHCEKDRMHSMHSLRHSLATRMLGNGTSIEIIADVLGHANVNSSINYLQVDIEQLRQCALEMEVAL